MNNTEIKKIIEPYLYKKNGITWINFEGSRSDYTVPMVFVSITPQGNLRVKDVMSTKEGGIPDSFRVRIAQKKPREDGTFWWWIYDGTGSIYFKPKKGE